jgi:hypothetical protein
MRDEGVRRNGQALIISGRKKPQGQKFQWLFFQGAGLRVPDSFLSLPSDDTCSF